METDFIQDIFTFLLQHYELYLVIFMGVVTAIIMTVINYGKKPLKKLTAKIPNNKIRGVVNASVIIVCSYLFAIGLWYLLAWLLPQYFWVDYKVIFLNGSLPIVTYALGEKLVTKDKAIQTITDIQQNEFNKETAKKTVKELSETLTAEKTDAEEELNKLLK